jgi:hypothetical protein
MRKSLRLIGKTRSKAQTWCGPRLAALGRIALIGVKDQWMAINPAHGEFLRAFVTRDAERADALNEQIPDDEREDFNNLVSAFFSIMLEQRFLEDSSHDAIRVFVDEMRYDYRKADPPIKPLVIEALIRAGCGEEHLLDDIPPHESLRAQYQVIRKIAQQSPTVIANFNGFLTDAETLAAQW